MAAKKKPGFGGSSVGPGARWLLVVSLVTTAALAGCARDGDGAQPAVTSGGQFGSAPATGTPSGPAVSPTASEPVLEDGKHVAYLTALDVPGKTITFDLVVFLTGAEANQACIDHSGPECPPPNDYFIVNDNPKLRTLPVSPAVQAKVLANLGGTDLVSIAFADLPAHFAGTKTGNLLSPLPFRLTVTNGAIVALEEMYLP